MLRWLRFGTTGVENPDHADAGQLKPSPTHWHNRVGDPKLIDADATPAQLAGVFWAGVSNYRAAANQPMSLPDVGRMIGAIKQLQRTRTQAEVVSLMKAIVANWPAIASALHWMIGLQLDEATLSNRRVIELASQLAAGQSIAPRPAVNRQREDFEQGEQGDAWDRDLAAMLKAQGLN
jgi:hypothetical protein